MDSECQNQKTVLIVDDDSQLTRQFAENCRKIGLSPHTARDVREASLLFDVALPDLLIFNVSLLAGNQRKFIDCLAEYEDTREIPVIMLCDPVDWEMAFSCETIVGYPALRSIDNWSRIEMFIRELVDVDSSLQDNRSSIN
jgi:DNA-binding NtrC family response regulator